MKEIEGTVRNFDTSILAIKIDYVWYNIKAGLLRQALQHFPVGTEVKASVEDNTVMSLVKNDPELIG